MILITGRDQWSESVFVWSLYEEQVEAGVGDGEKEIVKNMYSFLSIWRKVSYIIRSYAQKL